MSAEHEKDPSAALKRPRGGDGGLDGLGGPGAPLGSPEKKKQRKSNAQGVSFPLPSEYAPPPNPASDHLVAANPFDDSYSAVPYKPSGTPYFANPSYPGFGGYSAFRMPPHLLPRTASPYGGPSYPLRNQPHPCSPHPVGMVFNRPHAVNFGPPDGMGFGSQPSYNSTGATQGSAVPGQPFRPNPGENFGHMPSQNTAPVPRRDWPMTLGPGSSPACNNVPVEPNHVYAPVSNSYHQGKPSPKLGGNKHNAPPQPHRPPHGTEETMSLASVDLKTVHRNIPGNPESVLPKPVEDLNSPHTNGAPNKLRLLRGTPEGITSEEGGRGSSSSKIPLHPTARGHVASEPVYPCGICTHEVNDDQDAILCEASCQKWFHRICTGMTESAYGLLTAEAAAVWGCDTCMADKDVQLMRTRDTVGPPVLNAGV